MLKNSAAVLALAALLSLLIANPAAAQTAFVSDQLSVPLYAGPSAETEIVGRALPSGARLTLLQRDERAGFTRVRTESGLEGWLPTGFIADQPAARERLSGALQEIDRLTNTATELRGELQQLRRTESSTTDAASIELSLERLRAELGEMRQRGGSTVELEVTNQRLTELNAQLRQEIEILAVELQTLTARASQRQFLTGAALMLLGLLLGVAIKARPKRSAWS